MGKIQDAIRKVQDDRKGPVSTSSVSRSIAADNAEAIVEDKDRPVVQGPTDEEGSWVLSNTALGASIQSFILGSE